MEKPDKYFHNIANHAMLYERFHPNLANRNDIVDVDFFCNVLCVGTLRSNKSPGHVESLHVPARTWKENRVQEQRT